MPPLDHGAKAAKAAWNWLLEDDDPRNNSAVEASASSYFVRNQLKRQLSLSTSLNQDPSSATRKLTKTNSALHFSQSSTSLATELQPVTSFASLGAQEKGHPHPSAAFRQNSNIIDSADLDDQEDFDFYSDSDDENDYPHNSLPPPRPRGYSGYAQNSPQQQQQQQDQPNRHSLSVPPVSGGAPYMLPPSSNVPLVSNQPQPYPGGHPGSDAAFGMAAAAATSYPAGRALQRNATRRGRKELSPGGPAPVDAKGKKIPKALFDPKVRHQLEKLKPHTPWFMYFVTFVDFAYFAGELIYNQMQFGSPIQIEPFNYMVGPNPLTLIRLGGRFEACMRPVDYTCDYISSNMTCNQVCGMYADENATELNQWWRFVLPVFMHGGAIHLIMNMIFQIRSGWQMERDWGTWRMFFLYMIPGIGGFTFSALLSSQKTVSVGASGALFGLFACLMLDLFFNWRLLTNPWREFFMMIPSFIISFGMGLLPFLDQWAHLGGFITGIFAGLLFMPTIHFSKWDKRIKLLLRVLAVPLLVISMAVPPILFIQGRDFADCKICQYLDCLPVIPYC